MKLLSHYTDRGGLIGIATSQMLRATEFTRLNDKVEFNFAMKALYRAALQRALDQIPSELLDLIDSAKVIPHLAEQTTKQIIAAARASDGYDCLFVTSFARGRDSDEDDRGILTLWDRYTRNCGYCLQFDHDDICRLVDLEDTYCSYASIKLVDVKYGVDESGSDFLYLADQLSLVALHGAGQDLHNSRLLANSDKMDAPSYVERQLLAYCGSHKDPFFKDERETRILAYPISSSRARIITGLTGPKHIHRRGPDPDSPRFIAFLENRRSKLQPRRILIGPQAEMETDEVEALFPNRPEVIKPNYPI